MNRHWEAIARRKLGVGDDWEIFACERIGPDTLVTGGVPRLVQSGKNKGRKSWDRKVAQRAVIARAEMDIEHAAFEERTGKCWACNGDGKEFASWSKDTGTAYRPCRKCVGTGKSGALAAVAQ